MQLKELKDVSVLINKLSQGENLTFEETKRGFDICISEDEEGYFLNTLMVGLMAKGITEDELLGFHRSREALLPQIDVDIPASEIIDNSGTGGDKLKTFNISTTAAFVVAAAGVNVAKQSFFAVTGPGGSGDLFREFGIDVIGVSNPKTIQDTIKKIGFAPYIEAFLAKSEQMTGLSNFIKKRREIGLMYITPLHLAANLLSPIKMERRVYGVFDNKYSELLARFLQRIDYKKGLIVHGLDGLDEVSNIGDTEFVEFTDKDIKKYILSPEDFGIKKSSFEDIKAVSAEQNIIDFLQILFNKEKGPKRDAVLVNSAVCFYVLDKVSDFKEGVEMGKKIIETGKAGEKFIELVNLLGNKEKLKYWQEKAGIISLK